VKTVGIKTAGIQQGPLHPMLGYCARRYQINALCLIVAQVLTNSTR
jgi:hypothetical protein